MKRVTVPGLGWTLIVTGCFMVLSQEIATAQQLVGSITITYQWSTPTIMGYVAYDIIFTVKDTQQQPIQGASVDEDMYFPSPRHTHGDPPTNGSWLQDVQGFTDQNGVIKDQVQIPNMNELRNDPSHFYKRVKAVTAMDGVGKTKYVFNPNPNPATCTAGHTSGEWGTLPAQ